jgi:GNAT superfamily N-acetyltransferase
VPGLRSGGVGSRMLEHVLDWCRAERFSCVITWPTPRSRPFYRRGGFDRLEEPFIVELGPDDTI